MALCVVVGGRAEGLFEELFALMPGAPRAEASSVPRDDHVMWARDAPAGKLKQRMRPLLRRVADLSRGMAARLPEAADATRWRSDAQCSLYQADGSRYARHVDNRCADGYGQRCNGRRLSAIYYVNPVWEADHGGELRLWGKRGGGSDGREAAGEVVEPRVDVAPTSDRLVLFWSDKRNPHEVLPSHAPRFAISIWLYSTAELSRAAPATRAAMMLLPIEGGAGGRLTLRRQGRHLGMRAMSSDHTGALRSWLAGFAGSRRRTIPL